MEDITHPTTITEATTEAVEVEDVVAVVEETMVGHDVKFVEYKVIQP